MKLLFLTQVFDRKDATANAKLSSQIPYLMATSRIAHYLKAICRDKIGSFMSRSECETFLNRWLTQYVLAQDDATQSEKAQGKSTGPTQSRGVRSAQGGAASEPSPLSSSGMSPASSTGSGWMSPGSGSSTMSS